MGLRSMPDDVTILRPTGADVYGNPASSWATPAETTVKGFHVTGELILLPPDADVRLGDRVRVNGSTYSVEGEPNIVRSMRATKLITINVTRLEV